MTSNYEVSSDKRAISRAPGELKNVGIAVMIDQAVQNIQAEQLTQAVSARSASSQRVVTRSRW